MKRDKVNDEKITIGVLGGMGTYATINLFNQYAEVFPAKKEWDRPRIIIDNRCTMPSRVRAYLYHENVDQLIDEMSESMRNLLKSGCNKIILACNTSHLFLPAIYQKIPNLEKSIISIIDSCVNQIKSDGVNKVFLLGSEGTIESKIYQNALESLGVSCIVPKQEEYLLIRECIEAVKQNKYTESVKYSFLNMVNRYNVCLLGCTELPILYKKYYDDIICKRVYDPLFLALLDIKKEIK